VIVDDVHLPMMMPGKSMKNVMLGKTTLILKGESKNPPTDEVVKDYTSMLVLGKA
jgi:hypothetical protein